MQPDGRLLCAGLVTLPDGGPATAVVRYTTTGLLDSTFSVGGRFVKQGPQRTIRALLTLSDGTIVIGGALPGTGPTTDFGIQFLNSLGGQLVFPGTPNPIVLDLDGGDDGVHTMKLDRFGRIVVFGAGTSRNQNDAVLFRLVDCSRLSGDAGVDGGADGGVMVDAGGNDAGAPDASTVDAGVNDAGAPDASIRDAGQDDAGAPDAGSTSRSLAVGCGCASADRVAISLLLLALMMARLRRAG